MVREGIDWEGMSLHSRDRYLEIRRVMGSELDDNLDNLGFEVDEIASSDMSSEEIFDNNVFLENIDSILSTLSERDEYIIRERFGIGSESDDVRSMVSIGSDLGVTGSSVSFYLRRILWKLRGIRSKESFSKIMKEHYEYSDRV